MFDLDQIIRPHLRNFKRYMSARDEFTGEASIYLDANESPYPSELNRYPDSAQRRLRAIGAKHFGVAPSQLLFVNGSDEGIDLLIRAFAEPYKDKIIVTSPTYGMYAVWAKVSGVHVIDVPLLSDFSLNLEALTGRRDQGEKLLFLCAPNNPTGNLYRREDILSIVESFSGIVVVDEAYIDFASRRSITDDLTRIPNLVVLRTFSKAWGLAGLRVGAILAAPELIDVLSAIKPPYNLGTYAQNLILNVLSSEDAVHRVQQKVEEIKLERCRMSSGLSSSKLVTQVYLSESNFLLARMIEPKRIYSRLLENGIVVRDRSDNLHCEGCLRITIGTAAENNRVLEVLEAVK